MGYIPNTLISTRESTPQMHRASKFLSLYEDLISKTNYPSCYYEWTLLDKLRGYDSSYSSLVYEMSYKYPKVNHTLLAIKASFQQPFERIYPSTLQNWINEMSDLALNIFRKDELAYKQLILKSDDGYCDDLAVRYYKLCVKAFRKLSTICNAHPFGSPIIFEAARLASDIKAVADMTSTLKLQKLLDMDIPPITKNGMKILELSTGREGKSLEFKSSFKYDVKKDKKNKSLSLECTKTIASFLNSTGGTLLVGVSDSGEILGLKQDLSYLNNDEDKFVLSFKEAVKNSIGSSFFNNVEWHLETVGVDKKVLLVEVTRGSSPCFHYKDIFYVRNNASSDRIQSEQDINNFINDRFQK